MVMANSKGFLGDINIGVFKLGDSDVKLYLGDELVYPLGCEDETFYRIVGQAVYPSTIKGNDTSFDLSFDWEQVHIDTACTNSVIDSGNEETTFNVGINPSTASSRNFSGSYSFNGLDVPYDVEQEKSVYNIVTTYNITNGGSMKILDNPNDFAAVTVDGALVSPITTAYTFSRGTHTVKYLASNNLPSRTLANCRQMTSVTLSDGVESIGNLAFTNCTELVDITIPSTVKAIGTKAFYYNSNLNSVTIPNGVESIEESTFERCVKLKDCVIGNGVKTIGDNSFNHCQKLTGLTIGDNVETIGKSAFEMCTSLVNVTIPDSVKSIGNFAFQWGDSLKTLVIGSGITSIGESAFYSASTLTSITINAVTPPTLGNSALSYTNSCPIYVPAESVNAYKTANRWSSYASRIQAIP